MGDLRGRYALPLAVGLLPWLVYPRTGLDDLVERWFYDPATRDFPLRDAIWLTADVHSGLKLTVIVIAPRYRRPSRLGACPEPGPVRFYFATGIVNSAPLAMLSVQRCITLL